MLFYSRIFILIFFIVINSLSAIATPAPANTLKGRVTEDAHGEAIMTAVINIPELKTGAVTDSAGYYRIGNLPKGRYLIEVRTIDYSTVTRYVIINGTTEENFQLHQSIIEKNEVVITGTSVTSEKRKSVIPMESIRMQEMRENASTNIIDAVSKLPGVSQISTGPAISKPVIRGLSYNRIITLSDGVRQEGQQWGDEHGIEIDDYNVSHIEVLKGPASLAYGSDALAGVINIISDEPVPAGQIKGNIASDYQTNAGLGALNARLGGNEKGISWNVYGTAKAAHDYHNAYDGYVLNSRFSNVNYGATIGINKKWGYSRVSFTSFDQHLGIVEGNRDSATGKFVKPVNNNGAEGEQIAGDDDGKSYTIQTPSQRIQHQKLVWNNNIYLGNGARLGLLLGYQQNTRREFGDVLSPDEPGLYLFLQTYNYDVKYYFPAWKDWQVTMGVNGMEQSNKNKGIEFLVPDYKLFDAGFYTTGHKDIDKWSISGGFRINYRTISTQSLFTDSADKRVANLHPGGYQRFTAFDENYSNMVASLGVSYDVAPRTTIKFNVASGFRAPNIAELSANGVHEGTIRYEYGNKSLNPESSLQADIGVGWNSDHVLVSATVFYNYIKDYIYIRKLIGSSGADSIPVFNNPSAFPAFAYAQTNAGLYGGELFIDLHPHPLDWLHFENTFSYVRGVAFNGTDSTHNLPMMPPAHWLIELRAQKKSIGKWLKNTYAKTGVDINFAQNYIFNAYGTETASSGYTLLNAGVGFDVMSKKQTTLCTVNLFAQNITDVSYQNHLSRLRYADVNNITGRPGVFNQGRNFNISVNVPLDIRK